METIYKVQEVAQILRIGYGLALRLINEGKIKSLNTNGSIRVTQSALDEFLRGE